MNRNLRAYVSGALTGLSGEDPRPAYERAADLLREAGFEPYLPHTATDPVRHPQASPETVYERDRAAVSQADLMVAFLGRPSLGVGQEIEIAAAALVPLLVIARTSEVVSRMALGAPARRYGLIRYESLEELERELQAVLPSIAADIRAQGERHVANVGQPLARLRRSQGLSREGLAKRIGVSSAFIRLVETADPTTSNPSSTFLITAASVLGVSAGELLGTEPRTRLLESLEAYVAARGITDEDRDALLGIAARGLRGDRPLTAEQWERLREVRRIAFVSESENGAP